MAKNVRIVPSSGSLYFIGDGFDITGSVRFELVGSSEDIKVSSTENGDSILLINKEKGRIGIGAKVSASANLTVSGSTNNDVLFVQNESSSFSFSKEGVIVLPDFSSKTSANYSPADVEGGMWFSGSQFFVGT
jgi:hypothetical protein|tara:strand:- start:1564 stop:1962 length:399 start_codon:yes stop_codon:yes gene_type:complete